MTDQTWLRNFVSMTQLMQGLAFVTDCRLPKNQELIMIIQTGMPLLGWSEQSGNVKIENNRVIATKNIPKNEFITAYPGDIVECETKVGPIRRLSKRMKALDETKIKTDAPCITLNSTTKIASLLKMTDDEPLYCAHLVRNDFKHKNCVARNVQCGFQIFLFATQDIAAGDEIVCDWDQNKHPDHLCVWCLDPSKRTQFCSKCRFSSYCSKQCQTQHWAQHKFMCC